MVPIIAVDAIEPCLPFWTDRLGFALTVQVPHEDRLGFVILVKDGFEVMYQSRASLDADVPGVAAQGHGIALYVDVDDINAVERVVAGLDSRGTATHHLLWRGGDLRAGALRHGGGLRAARRYWLTVRAVSAAAGLASTSDTKSAIARVAATKKPGSMRDTSSVGRW